MSLDPLSEILPGMQFTHTESGKICTVVDIGRMKPDYYNEWAPSITYRCGRYTFTRSMDSFREKFDDLDVAPEDTNSF